jgi:hypothetical protein
MSDVDFGHFEAGNEHDSLDQLHQDHGSESDYGNQFGVFENDHHAAESTDFSTGHHQEFDSGPSVHAESDDYTNYSHDANVDDHTFAAEGSEHAHQADFSNLDALSARFDAGFEQGEVFHGGEGQFGIAGN